MKHIRFLIKTQHLAAIRTQVDTITRVIDRHQPDYTKAADILESRTISGAPQEGVANQLSKIDTAIQSVIDNAETLRFDPPQDATWWTTVEGKDRSRVEIHRNAASQLAGTLTATEVVGKLVKDIAAAMVAQTTRQDELHSRLEEIKQQFKEQQERLASVSKPFEFLTVDVELFTIKFPLIVGVILGIALVWPTYRRGHLMRAASLLTASESLDASTRAVIWQEYAKPPVVLSWSVAVLGVLFLVWTGIAANTLAASTVAPPASAWASASGGALAVIGALGFRYSWLRSCQSAARAEERIA